MGIITEQVEKIVTVWGEMNIFTPTKYSVAVVIPKGLALTKRITNGNKLRFKTMPDGTIIIEKVEPVGVE